MKALQTLRQEAASLMPQQLEQPFAELQSAGNQAAQAAMNTLSDAGGFLESFAAEDALCGVPAFDFSGPSESVESGNDESVLDAVVDLQDPKGTVAGDNHAFRVGADGFAVEAGSREVERDALLGDMNHDTRLRAGAGTDGTVGAGLASSMSDDRGNRSGFGVDMSSDGQITLGGELEAGELGGSLEGGADFDDDGGLQSLEARAGAKVGDVEAAVGGRVDLQTVAVDGDTVTWTWGGAVDGSVEVGDLGGGMELGRTWADAITFNTPEEAEAFARRLEDGNDAGRNRFRGADELMALPAGTQLSSSVVGSAQSEAGFVVGGGAEFGSTDHFDLEMGEGGKMTLTVSRSENMEGSLSASNGLVGASFGRGRVGSQTATYELDLEDPRDRAAWHTFQLNGSLPEGYAPTESEVLSGSSAVRSARFFGNGVTDRGSVQHGERREGDQVLEIVQGDRDLGGESWSRWSPVDGAASVLEQAAWLDESMPMLVHGHEHFARGAAGLRSWADRGREAAAKASGSVDGSEACLTRVYAPKGTTGEERMNAMTMTQTQRIAFDDRQQNAAHLSDAADPLTDLRNVDRRWLPDHAVDDSVWTLESTIDEKGTRAVAKLLASDAPVPGCDIEGMKALTAIREDFQADGATPEAFAEAMARFTNEVGADAQEMARVVAGEDAVEQYLKLEGDDTWIGLDGNETLDELCAGADPAMLEDLLESEQARAKRLSSKKYAEVPTRFRDQELSRLGSRVAEIRSRMSQ